MNFADLHCHALYGVDDGANELRYSNECISWIEAGLCPTIGRESHVLVDFSVDDSRTVILNGLNRLLNAGYLPILAHPERYRELTIRDIQACCDHGVMIPIDAQSLFGAFGFFAKWKSRRLLKMFLVDLIASDAHDTKNRTIDLTRSYEWVTKKYGAKYAEALLKDRAEMLFALRE